jgi:ectoine hydroxylase
MKEGAIMVSKYAAENERFQEDGFVLIPDLLSAEETRIVSQAAHSDDLLQNSAFELADTRGGRIRLSGWNHAGDDTMGIVARTHRIVNRMETFLGGEVYHYHSKMILKEPRVGGAWEWHQDYGYWYQNGVLYPDMASCLIAVDPATRQNGCLQVLKGSHKMGRIEHGRFGGQTGADPERVNAAVERLEMVYCEMRAGTGLFFHSNLLHCSAQNTSDQPRWAFICCYNAARNDPYKESHHPKYNQLIKVNDRAILETGVKATTSGSAFVEPSTDNTSDGVKVGT